MTNAFVYPAEPINTPVATNDAVNDDNGSALIERKATCR